MYICMYKVYAYIPSKEHISLVYMYVQGTHMYNVKLLMLKEWIASHKQHACSGSQDAACMGDMVWIVRSFSSCF